jgi:hypothetical protein
MTRHDAGYNRSLGCSRRVLLWVRVCQCVGFVFGLKTFKGTPSTYGVV